MSITYLLLFFTVIVAFSTKNQYILWQCILGTVIAAMIQHVVQPIGAIWLLVFSMACYVTFCGSEFEAITEKMSLVVVAILTAGFLFHRVPGFSNLLVIDYKQISPLSQPYTMYFNFDSVMAALILYATSGLQQSKKQITSRNLMLTLQYLILAIGVASAAAYWKGCIQYDLKMPDFLGIWILNQFFFVCASEEVIFRGWLQGTLKKHMPYYLAILAASIVFGLRHYNAGMSQMLLASLAGVFYGYTYHRTNNLLCAMLIHFGVNCVHLIFFTYPALALQY